MALEDLTGGDKGINHMVASNPDGLDARSEGDNHIRGVKNVLKNVFGDMLSRSASVPPHGAPLVWDAVNLRYTPVSSAKDADLYLSSIYGSVKYSVLNAEPGWIIALGQALTPTEYPNLRAWVKANPNAITSIAQWNGGRWGLFAFAGDDQANGNMFVPRLIGYFLRGANSGTGGLPDVGRNAGSTQGNQNASHNHNLSDPGHQHIINRAGDLAATADTTFFVPGMTLIDSLGKTTITGTGITLSPSGGNESRPDNIALFPLIFAGRQS